MLCCNDSSRKWTSSSWLRFKFISDNKTRQVTLSSAELSLFGLPAGRRHSNRSDREWRPEQCHLLLCPRTALLLLLRRRLRRLTWTLAEVAKKASSAAGLILNWSSPVSACKSNRFFGVARLPAAMQQVGRQMQRWHHFQLIREHKLKAAASSLAVASAHLTVPLSGHQTSGFFTSTARRNYCFLTF